LKKRKASFKKHHTLKLELKKRYSKKLFMKGSDPGIKLGPTFQGMKSFILEKT